MSYMQHFNLVKIRFFPLHFSVSWGIVAQHLIVGGGQVGSDNCSFKLSQLCFTS